MIETLINNDNLSEKDIEEIVVRVKALIINSNDEILLGYSNKTYQFPGGHVEEGESLTEALEREIKEETGIELDLKDIKPYKKLTYYSKNYRNSGVNRQNDIYYFIVHTDLEPNENNINLDEYEKEYNYTTKRIKLSDLEKVLNNSIKDNPINEIIVEEMMSAINDYKMIYYN